MKYSTYVALIATVSVQAQTVQNPDKIIDGAAFEAFQKEALKIDRDAKIVFDKQNKNFQSWANEQGQIAQGFEEDSEEAFNYYKT